MTTYLTIKLVHIALAVTSGAGFALRGAAMLRGSELLRVRWIKVAPHVVDTLLLVTGITLAVHLRVSPLEQSWFGVKLAAIVAYIVLGTIAFKSGRARRRARAAFIGALAVFCYILAVAQFKAPWPLL